MYWVETVAGWMLSPCEVMRGGEVMTSAVAILPSTLFMAGCFVLPTKLCRDLKLAANSGSDKVTGEPALSVVGTVSCL